MNKEPLVSVIITYYKKKHFLKNTLKSILNQTYKNYEIIFVFDDEDKNDLKFVKQNLLKFKKKKLIINNKNLGVAKSRNLALKNSNGSYVAFIDSDDLWKKKKLSKQIEFMKRNSCDFSFTSYSIIDEKNGFVMNRKVSKDADYQTLMKSNYIGLNTVIANKKILRYLYFPYLRTQEDFAVWLKLCRKGIKLRHLKENLSYWRKTENSLSSNTLLKVFDAFKLFYFYEKKNFIFSIYSVLVLSYNKVLKNYL